MTARTKPSFADRLAVQAIRIYQWTVSPLLRPSCRYLPTCSEYAVEAICVHGLLRGAAMAGKRLLRCHPWAGHGFDPVPKGARPHTSGGPTSHP